MLPVLFAAVIVVAILLPVAAWASYFPITNTSDTTPPPAPGSLVVDTSEEGKVKLTWIGSTDNPPDSGISGYIVYRSAQTFTDATKKSTTAAVEVVATIATSALSGTFTDAGVVRGDLYYYAVSEENGAGLESPISAVTFGVVTGQNQFPHTGYSETTNLCRNCHKIHRSPAQSRVFRKTNVSGGGSEETCFACHDGTGSKYDIKQSFPSAAHNTILTTPATIDIRCVHCHNPHKASQVVDDNPFLTRKLEETLCFTCHKNGHSRNGWSIDRQFSAAYSMSWHSILSTVTADGLPGARVECTNCHGPHTAMAGDATPATNNPGSEFLSRLSYPFNTYVTWGSQVGGIDESRETPANFVNFCLNCHRPAPWPTATFEAATFIPYTIAFPTMDPATYPFFYGWDKTAFTTSAHYGTGNLVACRNCHHPHASENPRLNAFFNPNTDTTNFYDVTSLGSGGFLGAREERLCFNCHQATKQTGYTSAPDIKSDIDKTDPGSTQTNPTGGNNPSNGTWFSMPIKYSPWELRHKDTENSTNFSGTNRHVECVDCHDPHKAKARDTVGGNTIRPANVGAFGVGATNGSTGSTPTYTIKMLGSGDKEFELCLKCHSAFAYGGSPPISPVYGTGVQGDKSIEFNPANSAFHPVEAAGKNVSQNLCLQLQSAFGLDCSTATASQASLLSIRIRCSDCHTTDRLEMANGAIRSVANTWKGQVSGYTGSIVVGPHGSIYQSVRKGSYIVGVTSGDMPGSYDGNNFRICFSCHDEGRLAVNRRFSDIPPASTNFYGAGRDNLHYFHLNSQRKTCKMCHYNVHSNVAGNNTIWRITTTDGITRNYGPGQPDGPRPPSEINTHLVNFAPQPYVTHSSGSGVPIWAYDARSTSQVRTCYVRCHGGTMDGITYRPTQGDQPPGQ